MKMEIKEKKKEEKQKKNKDNSVCYIIIIAK